MEENKDMMNNAAKENKVQESKTRSLRRKELSLQRVYAKAELYIRFNSEEDKIFLAPTLRICAEPITEKETRFLVRFYGENKKEGYEAQITINDDGSISDYSSLEHLPEGLDKVSTGLDRVLDIKMVEFKDGLHLIPKENKGSIIAAEVPVVIVSKTGITVGDRFFPMYALNKDYK